MSQSNVAWLPVSDEEWTCIDLDDLALVIDRPWFKHPGGYASNRHGLLHRALLKPPKGMEVDHINRDKLDNRRSNLRVCKPSNNQHNRPGVKGSKSGFKGVSLHNKTGLWRARLMVNWKEKSIGYFQDKYDAATAYNFAVAEFYGQYAVYNTVPQPWLEQA